MAQLALNLQLSKRPSKSSLLAAWKFSQHSDYFLNSVKHTNDQSSREIELPKQNRRMKRDKHESIEHAVLRVRQRTNMTTRDILKLNSAGRALNMGFNRAYRFRKANQDIMIVFCVMYLKTLVLLERRVSQHQRNQGKFELPLSSLWRSGS
jgi:hypothetical protein